MLSNENGNKKSKSLSDFHWMKAAKQVDKNTNEEKITIFMLVNQQIMLI